MVGGKQGSKKQDAGGGWETGWGCSSRNRMRAVDGKQEINLEWPKSCDYYNLSLHVLALAYYVDVVYTVLPAK